MLRRITHPIGHVLSVVLTIGALAAIFWLIQIQCSVYQFYAGMVALIVLFILPMSVILNKWGYSYVIYDQAGGHAGQD